MAKYLRLWISWKTVAAHKRRAQSIVDEICQSDLATVEKINAALLRLRQIEAVWSAIWTRRQLAHAELLELGFKNVPN
jgi:hypothetical protein